MATIPGKWHRPSDLWRKLRPAARRLRKEPTEAEAALWERLRQGRMDRARFRRQHPIGHYVVDFCCPSERLVLEVDGPIHDSLQEQDRVRQAWLEARGYRVLRFTNEDILTHMEIVLQRIREVLDGT